MKISDLLCQYLYQNKELVLEGFGVFHLDASVNPQDTKEPQQVYQGITFENNAKAKTQPALIDFLVQHSGKMKPLAISDLDAYVTTGRELLNLGKPLILNGIGTLTSIRNQILEFTPGPFIPVRLDPREGQFRERVATSEDELFRHEEGGGSSTSGSANRGILLIVAIILVLLVAGWGVYHFAFQKKSGTGADTAQPAIQPVEQAPAAQKDTTSEAQNAAKPDSGKTAPTGASLPAVTAIQGPVSYRVLIQTFNDPAKAHRRYDSLKIWGHNVVLAEQDSTHYSLYMPFSGPLADTGRVKDSLSVFFGHRVSVQPVH
jgi:hypothetical protein